MFKLILVFIVVWIGVLRWVRRRKIECCNQFKNDISAPPLIGHAYMLAGNGEDKMKAIKAGGREALKQGGVTMMQSWIFDHFYLVVADAEVAELILRNCLEKDDSMKMFKSFFGNGLLVSSVAEWRKRRRLLNPAFAIKNLNENVEIFQKNSDFLANKLQKETSNGPVTVYDPLTAYALDSVFESIYGLKIEAQKNPQHPVMKALMICCELVSNRMCLPWLHNQTVYEMTSQFTTMKTNAGKLFDFLDETIVKKCKEIRSGTNTENNILPSQKPKNKSVLESILEALSQNNEKMSEEYLREETFVVTFAGTETTSIALSFALVMMSRHPDIQDKVYQEVMQELGDSDKPIQSEDLPHLRYTDAVLKETLRMYPVAPVMLRKIDKEITLPSGKFLAAGTAAMINIWAVHHNPHYWEEPELFRPERFLEDGLKHPAAFLPFSYGVRNCIGSQYAMMSMKTTLATLLRRYRVLPANDDPNATKIPLRVHFDVMMRDVDDFRVQFVSRV